MNLSIPSYESHGEQSSVGSVVRIVETVSLATKANQAMEEFSSEMKRAVENYYVKMAQASMVLGVSPNNCTIMSIIEDELLKLSHHEMGSNWRAIKEAQEQCASCGHGDAVNFGHLQPSAQWCSLCAGTISSEGPFSWNVSESASLASGMEDL
ncbi:MAG: hypothetical protein COB04_16205 [Gammaproteobacteria bacterium]|nr:MAG: hypothetical protein COB04_16205 [Gammaproteobacteria bacterium]